MNKDERDKLILQTHQAVLGVPDTEDKGLVGDVKELKQAIKEQNGRYRKLSKVVWTVVGVLCASGCGLGMAQLLGG